MKDTLCFAFLYQKARDKFEQEEEVKKKKKEEAEQQKQFQNMFAGHDRRKVRNSSILS